MSMSQKQGVYVVVMNVLAECQISFDDGQSTPAKEILGKTGKEQVVSLVTAGLLDKTIEMTDDSRAKYDTPEKMRSYAQGLVNNHLTKDVRLNGGAEYQPKNPGARTGSSDDQIKELKKLKIMHADDAALVTEIDAAITARQAEINAEKAKTVEIDASKLPDRFKHLA